MFKKNYRMRTQEKIVDIEAGLQGNIKFDTPVNLKISGKFEGELDTKGTLAIGEKADVKATMIKGDVITISGKVRGDIISNRRLELIPPAKVIGNIKAPILVINEGAMLKGKCQMPIESEKDQPKEEAKKHKRSSKKKK